VRYHQFVYILVKLFSWLRSPCQLSSCWMHTGSGLFFNFFLFTSPRENQCQLRYWIDANSVELWLWHLALFFNDRSRDPVRADYPKQLQHARRSTSYRSEIRNGVGSRTIDRRLFFLCSFVYPPNSRLFLSLLIFFRPFIFLLRKFGLEQRKIKQQSRGGRRWPVSLDFWLYLGPLTW
jgi:hypothetical protein